MVTVLGGGQPVEGRNHHGHHHELHHGIRCGRYRCTLISGCKSWMSVAMSDVWPRGSGTRLVCHGQFDGMTIKAHFADAVHLIHTSRTGSHAQHVRFYT